MFPYVETKASGVDELSSQDSSECVRKEDLHISISHRRIAVLNMTENEKTSSHIFFRPFWKRAFSSMFRDNKIFISVMCSLSEAVSLHSKANTVLF
jgi:hypothetical protein